LGTVHLAWDDDGTIASTEVASGFAATAADLEVDASGDMHLALYASAVTSDGGSMTDPQVRYVRIGSGD
jgi:hypothetical protein